MLSASMSMPANPALLHPPYEDAGRIFYMDALRGFAVLGILWINIFVFAMPYANGSPYTLLNDSDPLNQALFMANYVFLEGSWRGLFSLLFGASALIILAEKKLASSALQVVDYYYRRNVFLILFGLAHAYLLLWPYDVLFFYGVLGLFLLPLRHLSARALLIAGITLVLLTDINLVQRPMSSALEEAMDPVSAAESSEQLSPEIARLSEIVTAMAEQQSQPASAAQEQGGNEQTERSMEIEAETLVYRSDYGTIFTYQQQLVMDMHTTRFYQNFFFDIGGMMLIGMALFKLGMLSGQWSRRRYFVIAMVTGLAGLLIRGSAEYINNNYVFDESAMWVDALNVGYGLGRLLLVFAYIGLLGLLCHSVWLRPFVRLLASVGRMSLTAYIMQTVIAVMLFYGIGLGLFAYLERYQVALVCVAIWITQLAFSITWLHFYRQGPLEWLWRSLIQGQWQSNRLPRSVVAPVVQNQAG